MRYVWYAVGMLVAGIVAFFAIGLLADLTSYKSVARGKIGVCQTGGPIQGNNGTCGVLTPGSGRQKLGKFNDLRQFPVTQRNITVGRGSEEKIPAQTLPTRDGVLVTVTGRAVFTLVQRNVLGFYANYGQREYDGKHPYDDEGWNNFVRMEMGPVFQQAMSQVILSYDCVQLNPACGNLKGDVKDGAGATSNILQGQNSLARQFNEDLQVSLDGAYFNNVRVTKLTVTLPEDLQAKVNQANAAKADAATATAQGAARIAKNTADNTVKVNTAEANANAKKAEAKGIKAINKAYEHSPAKASIDAIAALPRGITSLVIGGNNGLQLTKQVK